MADRNHGLVHNLKVFAWFFACACVTSQCATVAGARTSSNFGLGGRALLQSVTPASLPNLTAVEAVALLCSRNITAVEYVTALNDRYENGGYSCNNPWITYNISKVLEDAAAVDAKAANGSDVGLFPATSAPLVDQYLAANGIILGKANLGELQSGGATNPTVSGTNREGFVYNITTALNPYDPTRTPQGSSSGPGVALGARIAPWGLCEDTGGSCRLPAAAQGLYSLRPTIGCYNFSDGLQPYQITRDTIGSIAHTASDLVFLDSIVRNSAANTTGNGAVASPLSCAVSVNSSMDLRGVRLGLPSTLGWVTPGISGEVAGVINSALQALRDAGAVLVPFDSSPFQQLALAAWPGATTKSLMGNLDAASAYESIEVLGRYLALHNYSISVTDVVNQINRPAEKASYVAAEKAYSTTDAGSTADFIYYLKTGMLMATYNGTGQPGPTDTWSAFDLSFSGSNCSSELLGYNGAAQLGTGPPARFNGTLAVVTGVAPANTTGVVTA
ncbi:hypothetical protein ABBQ38_003263 [Trebouxia sp. C0009 RCD-2024]